MNGSYLCEVHSLGEMLLGSWQTSVEVWAAMGEGKGQMVCVGWGGGTSRMIP